MSENKATPQQGLVKFLEPQIPTMGRLMSLYMPGVDTVPIVQQELEYLEYKSVFLPEIKQCIPETIVAAVKSVIKQNLSLDPDAGLVYITTRNVKVGGQWCKALEIKPSPDGKISIARQCGRVLDLEKPYCTYMADGRVDTANIKIQVPAVDEKGNTATRWEVVTLGYSQFDRLRWFSHRDKSRNKPPEEVDSKTLNCANSLYTSWNGWIDPEFACAKVINAAMKRKGTNMAEKRMAAVFTGPTERFVSPEILKAMEDDDLEFTGYEEVKDDPQPTGAPAQPAAAQPAPQQAPPPPPPPQAQPQAQPTANPEQAAIVLITNCATKRELDDLWKANKDEWNKSDSIKKAISEKKNAFKNPAAAPQQAPPPPAPIIPPPPPPQPAAPVAFSLDDPQPTGAPANIEFYKKVLACKDAEEIRQLYTPNKDAINADEVLKDYLVKTGQELANGRPRPVCPIQIPGITDAAPVVATPPADETNSLI